LLARVHLSLSRCITEHAAVVNTKHGTAIDSSNSLVCQALVVSLHTGHCRLVSWMVVLIQLLTGLSSQWRFAWAFTRFHVGSVGTNSDRRHGVALVWYSDSLHLLVEIVLRHLLLVQTLVGTLSGLVGKISGHCSFYGSLV
jgi:hypothetical protein